MIRTKLLIAITCALSASLAFSSSAFSGGDGSASNPYLVSCAEDLNELALLSETDTLDGKYFLQTADISFEGSDGFAISENESLPFMGSYNGMDYDISDITLTTSGNASGLFVYAEDAEFKNIELKNAVISASSVSGGITAKASGETVIESCSFQGTAVFPSSAHLGCNVGGIAGSVGENATVNNCTAYLTMDVEKSPLILYAGCIAGYSKGVISECTGYADISAVSDNYLAGLGSIVGENEGIIAGCESAGSISGEITNDVALLYIGGITGHNNGGTIERTINKAALSATGLNSYPGYIGGIAGYNESGDVSVSSNNGSVGGSVSYAGGVTGINYASTGTATVTECLNIGEITVSNGISGGIVGGNLATSDAANVSTVSSSVNLYELADGNGAIGVIQTDFVGVSLVGNLIVRNLTDANASTMTDEELTGTTGIDVLKSDAWVYPQNGFLPSLAVIKNLEKNEVVATALDKENEKAAFTVYNPGDENTAVAVLAFYKNGRLSGTKLVNINVPKGYSVHTADTEFAASADKVSIMVVRDTVGLVPFAKLVSY